ncbi:DUF2339 domain-containing protein [Aliamphritea hakodatensis]|uniref:DUF2339 domain-containing protein n=1 Tax=Aliamphritea hakodatensis TaxID=2895352 RepID=UPI0022FDAC21|nr:DUF2339 domain-containing protein [Aliamphritea hakodatensis]
MLWILLISGAVLGLLMLEIPGAVIGALIGYLFASLLQQSKRIKTLEQHVVRLTAEQQKTQPQPIPHPADQAETDEPAADTEAAATPVVLDAPAKIPAHKITVTPKTPDTTPVIVTETAPAQPATETTAADPWTGQSRPAAEDTATATTHTATDAPPQGNLFTQLQQGIVNYFTQGNLSIRIGIIVLFFGISFLVKYSIDNALLPIEFRLTAAAAGAIIMLTIGWKLRLKRPDYGLIMQGGAIAILYLLSFASFKMYAIIGASLAFPLLIMLSILGMSLAVIQNSKALAVTAITGGFAAPVLASTGSGNYVALFSYYSVLNLAIFAVAWLKSWRLLNVTGFYFTFAISLLWGVDRYRPEMFSSVEPFLIIFFLIYLTIAVLFATKQPPKLRGLIDGSLVFGLPIAAFSLQASIVSDFAHGLSLSALVLALVYLTLAKSLWQRQHMRLLAEAFLATGVVFATLSIAFELDGRWSAAVWAVEGCGLIWIGLRQQRRAPVLFGCIIQLAGGALLLEDYHYNYADMPFLNGHFLSIIMVALPGIISAWLLSQTQPKSLGLSDKIRRPAAMGYLIWGLVWWYAGGLIETETFGSFDEIRIAVLFFGLSALLWLAMTLWLRWQLFSFALWLLIIPLLLCAASTLISYLWNSPAYHFLSLNNFDAWLLAFTVLYSGLRCSELRGFSLRWPNGLHSISYLLGSLILAFEVYWLLNDRETADAWTLSLPAVILSLALLLISARSRWPFNRWPLAYATVAACGLMLILAWWSVIDNFLQVNLAAPLPYLPLLNPVDLAQLMVLLSGLHWYRHSHPATTLNIDTSLAGYLLGAFCFIWFNVMLCKTLHVYSGVAYRPDSLLGSARVQMALSISWTIIGLSLMVTASRLLKRQIWIIGAALMGVVVAKLFIFDLSDRGTVERIVSFIVVGLLLLVVGYFSPAPPKQPAEEKPDNAADGSAAQKYPHSPDI